MTQYYQELFCYIKHKIPNKDNAQEIVQESYARAISVGHHERIDNPRALLYRIAKNIIIDRVRKHAGVQEVPYEEDAHVSIAHEPETLLLAQDRQMVLMQALRTLPKMRKEVFVLHVLEGYKREEVANMMGISLNAVEKHLSRASSDLRDKIQQEDGAL